MRHSIRFGLAVLLLFTLRDARAGERDYTAPGVTLSAGDPAGATFKPLERLEVGDSLSVELSGARPRTAVEMFLQDDRGREWSYSKVHSDARGNVPRTLFWYQSGVIGTTTRRIEHVPDPSFRTFDEAENFFAGNGLRLTVRETGGRLLATRDFRPAPRKSPFIYPSNGQGVLENAINARDENLYVTGRNFPAGATVQLFLVPNRFGWATDDQFDAVDQAIKTITLGASETGFTAELLSSADAAPGTFDIIARVGDDDHQVILPGDIISFGEDTGVVLYYIIINGNIVIESAGRMKESPAYFEFSNAFEKGEDVYAAVDPTDVPIGHTGGSYAAHWTVAHQDAAYWDGPNPTLIDVSGDGPEIHRVKFWCINSTRTKIWSAATQAAPMAGYDVVVDFGAFPANESSEFVPDNTYTQGLDFLDGYGEVGFWVFEDPGATGSTPVGTVEYLDPNGISGISDPAGVTGPMDPVTLAWARITYPAAVAGNGTPLAAGGPFPVALFLHGRHERCDNDGAGSMLVAPMDIEDQCPQSQRIPSHEGYNYIMDELASQGVFCISINAYDIQPGLGQWDYIARGKLVLKFLDKLRDWTTNGNDPFGGILNGKLDMTRVALSGHSRGGEGVTAAQVLNATWPVPHSILAVNSIAPTDSDSTDWVPTSPYFLLIGARDGDVSSMAGFRTYDHAFPNGMANRKPKAVSWVYGANHNYFNTIWTPTAALGVTNPWAGSRDDCFLDAANPMECTQPMTAADQRQVALTTITAFFRWHLLDVTPYREILTGVVKPASMDNDRVFWTFQDGDRNAIDDFEQQPLNVTLNTVGGVADGLGFSLFEERLLNSTFSSYSGALPKDTAFKHDTLGLKLGWNFGQSYTTEIPAGPHRNVSMYTHLTLRVAKKATAIPPTAGPDAVLYVHIEDSMGNIAMFPATSSNFARIPHPFVGSELPNLAQMSGIRIPLRYFTKSNSAVNLTDIVRITINTEAPATEIGIDDIEFGK